GGGHGGRPRRDAAHRRAHGRRDGARDVADGALLPRRREPLGLRGDPARRALAPQRRVLGGAHRRGARRGGRGRRRGARRAGRAPHRRERPRRGARPARRRPRAAGEGGAVVPEIVAAIAFGWATVLLVAGGLLILRSDDPLERVL